jgi:hypothetical protein
LSSFAGPVLAVQFWFSNSGFPLFSSGYPDLSVQLWLSSFWLSSSGCPILAVQFWLSHSDRPLLLSHPGCPLLAVSFWLSSSGWRVLVVPSSLSWSGCPIQSFSGHPVLAPPALAILFWLSCPDYSVFLFLCCLSHFDFPLTAVLSWSSCPVLTFLFSLLFWQSYFVILDCIYHLHSTLSICVPVPNVELSRLENSHTFNNAILKKSGLRMVTLFQYLSVT